MHILLISENEFKKEIKRDGITFHRFHEQRYMWEGCQVERLKNVGRQEKNKEMMGETRVTDWVQ